MGTETHTCTYYSMHAEVTGQSAGVGSPPVVGSEDQAQVGSRCSTH